MQLYIKIIFFLAAGIFFLSGCSASSTASRYNKSENEKDNSQYQGRYDTKSDFTVSKTDSLEFDLIEEDETEFEDYTGEQRIDYSQVLKNFSDSDFFNADLTTEQEKMLMEIIKYLDTPYKYGGNSKKGIDCSAFTQNVYSSSVNLKLLRSARDQYSQGETINSIENLKFGDLVFFDTRRRVKPGHVGIYLGDNLFVHASRTLGVTVSSLNENYYSKRYMGARRVQENFSN